MGNFCKKVGNAISNGFKKIWGGISTGVKAIGKAIYKGVKKVVTTVGKLIYRGLVLVGNLMCRVVKYIWKNRKKIIDGILWVVDKVEVIIDGIRKIVELKRSLDDDMGTNKRQGMSRKS